MPFRCAVTLSLISLFWAVPASGSWDDVPLGVLLDQSSIVATGEVVRIEADGDSEFEFAVVRVQDYLRDNSSRFARELRIRQRNRNVSSTTLRLQAQTRAIFCLKNSDPLELDHPDRVVPVANRALVAEVLEMRQNLAHGEPVEGLALRAELVGSQWIRSGTMNREQQYYFFRISMLSVASKSIPVDTEEIVNSLRSDRDQVRSIGGKLALKQPEKQASLSPNGVIFFGPTARNTGAFMVAVEDFDAAITIGFVATLNGMELHSNQLVVPHND